MVFNWLSSKIGGNFQKQDSETNSNNRTNTTTTPPRNDSKNSLFYGSNDSGVEDDSNDGSYDDILEDGARRGGNSRLRDLSPEARDLLEHTLEPFVRTPKGCIVDHLVNLFGIGTETNCMAHKEIRDRFSHPIKYFKFKAFTSACAINDINQWDRQYVVRVVQLMKELKSHYPFGKSILSSIDKRYDFNGEPKDNLTGLYVPNDYLMDIVHDFPDLFIPCISIHPYRKDAVDELLKWIVKGVRYVRWLPVSQGINVASPLCDAFYEALVQNDIILFVHTGVEHSLVEPPNSDSHLGNPLLLRRPLDKGVKIVAVHCGGEGKSFDYDEPSKPTFPIIPNLHLFLRLLHEEKYNNNLIGDLSGIVAFDRVDALVPLLDHKHIHHRLVYSSDYPIPSVNLAVITTLLANRGLITPDQRELVNEIYKFNPILFDFVLKRIIRSPITGNYFNISIFKENPFFNISIDKNRLMGTPSSNLSPSDFIGSPSLNDQLDNLNISNGSDSILIQSNDIMNVHQQNNNNHNFNHQISNSPSTTTTTTTTQSINQQFDNLIDQPNNFVYTHQQLEYSDDELEEYTDF